MDVRVDLYEELGMVERPDREENVGFDYPLQHSGASSIQIS